MTLNKNSNQGFWMEQFGKRLSSMDGKTVTETNHNEAWNNMIKRWNEGNNKDQGLEQMFKKNPSGEPNSVKAYADFFGLNLSSNTWEELKNADISKKE